MKKTISEYCGGNAIVIGYLEVLEKRLKKSRFVHTLGVVETAAQMAKAHGAEPEKAMIAAALHDFAKNLTQDELLDYAQAKKLLLTDEDLKSPEVLHGPVGAEMVREAFGIEDVDILNAIRFHTIGRAGMSLLEKIVYLADAIEPGRSEYPELKNLRKLAFEDLDKGILLSVKSTINYVLERGFFMHPSSVALYNELVCLKGEL